jgi:GNAT superfamily N-acetyltransferase
MRIARVHPGAVQRARLRKPAITAVGAYGIALHDELELELLQPLGRPALPAHVRPGAMADIPAVLGLLDGATRWLAGLGRTGQWGTQPHSPNPRRLEAMARWVPPGHLHVAEIDGRMVGALVVGAAPDFVPMKSEPELYVNLLVTDRTHKGAGLGGMLLDHARALALRRGLPLLRADCYDGGDRALVAWYERQGFTATDPFTVRLPDGTDWPGQLLELPFQLE